MPERREVKKVIYLYAGLPIKYMVEPLFAIVNRLVSGDGPGGIRSRLSDSLEEDIYFYLVAKELAGLFGVSNVPDSLQRLKGNVEKNIDAVLLKLEKVLEKDLSQYENTQLINLLYITESKESADIAHSDFYKKVAEAIGALLKNRGLNPSLILAVRQRDAAETNLSIQNSAQFPFLDLSLSSLERNAIKKEFDALFVRV